MNEWKEPKTIVDLLDRNVTDFPQREALISVSQLSGEESRLTWEDFEKITNQWAEALREAGVQKGEKVALLLGNCAECYLAYVAVLKLGAVMLPINIRLVSRELEYIINHSEAEYLLMGDSFLKPIDVIRSRIARLKKIILLTRDETIVPSWGISIHELLAGKRPLRIHTPLVGTDISDLIYTTGTTGNPKGCILTHGSKVACGRMIGVSLGLRRLWTGWERCQNPFPFFTSSGISSMFMPWLYYGYTEILEPMFDVEMTLQTIEKEKSTMYLAAPSMFVLILNHSRFEKYDTSSVRTFGYGGSLMPAELMRRIFDKWPTIRLYHVYGLTEGGTGGMICPPSDAMRKIGAIGIPWGPDQEVRVVNENDLDVPTGEVGEIILRGPNIMKGYYKDAQATEETLKNGWLHTGDLGRVDEEGFVYFIDRQKDMIVRGGYNVYAAEVEKVLYEHPAVSQCAIIGKHHEVLGEDVMAVVVLRSGCEATAEELMIFCKDKMADYKRPRVIEFQESLPLNAMGKVDKKVLRVTYGKGK